MLKVATDPDERNGARTMAWWDGDGAARVLAVEGEALLLERALGSRSLAEMSRDGRDADATGILCEVVARLHRPRPSPPSGLVPLPVWFRELGPVADAQGGILARCAEVARSLLAAPAEPRVLHGDVQHDNVVDFGVGGWLAIDPKNLWGDRAFDYANIFTNPDLADPTRPVAVRREIFATRLDLVAARAALDRAYLLDWILAWTGLSAAWFIGAGEGPATDLAVARLAAATPERSSDRHDPRPSLCYHPPTKVTRGGADGRRSGSCAALHALGADEHGA